MANTPTTFSEDYYTSVSLTYRRLEPVYQKAFGSIEPGVKQFIDSPTIRGEWEGRGYDCDAEYQGVWTRSVSRGGTYDTTPRDIATRLFFDFKEIATNLTLRGWDLAENQGAGKAQDLTKTMMDNAYYSHLVSNNDNGEGYYGFAAQFFGDGTGNGGLNMGGLGSALDNGGYYGSYGTVTRSTSTNAWNIANIKNYSASSNTNSLWENMTLAEIQKQKRLATHNGGSPSVIFTSGTPYDYVMLSLMGAYDTNYKLIVNQGPYRENGTIDIGAEGRDLNQGIPVLGMRMYYTNFLPEAADGSIGPTYAASQQFWGLSPKDVFIKYLPGCWAQLDPLLRGNLMRPTNQSALMGQIITRACVGTRLPRNHFNIFARY